MASEQLDHGGGAEPGQLSLRATLSVCVITLDEERDLPRCLASVRGLADQIVVVDSGSRDRTREIARDAGALVVERAMTGYADQKNAALALATGDWVLGLDADEWLDDEARAAISRILEEEPVAEQAGYRLCRSTIYLGRRLRGTSAAREWKARLVRRGRGRWVGAGDRELHERLEAEGRVGRLRGRLLHEPFRDLSEHASKTLLYARLWARNGSPPGRLQAVWGVSLEPVLVWLKEMVLRLGALDGVRGLVYSGFTAGYFFLRAAYGLQRSREWAMAPCVRMSAQDSQEEPEP